MRNSWLVRSIATRASGWAHVAGLVAGLSAQGCGDREPLPRPVGIGGTSGEQAGAAGVAPRAGAGGAGALAAGSGGIVAQAGRGAAGGQAGASGSRAAGSGGASGTTSGTGGQAGSTGGAGGAVSSARFSFFMASQAGLGRLSKNTNGFGGDLRFGKPDGLSGADEICRQLAEASMPENGKTWRAFLSVTKGPDGMPVNAIDRIGAGPWYDRRERIFAMNKAALMSARPQGADPVIVNDFPNEDGVPNHDPGTGIVDNHNVLTGSTTAGTVDAKGLQATCQDWTNATAGGGKPRAGVSWPRAQLTHWISILNEGGCAPGATPPGAESGQSGTVGALGGYGGIYCFALTP